MEFPDGLDLAVICERDSPFDAFVSNHYRCVEELPQGAIVGTASLRRQSQLSARRPDLDIRTLRGNVNTRLAKLDRGDYDAIILAASGLKRLEFHDRIRQEMPAEESLPAVGQGALGIECRSEDSEILELLKPLSHRETELCVRAERAMNHRLHGGCQVPIAGYATLEKHTLTLQGMVASVDGRTVLGAKQDAPEDQAETLGRRVADALLQQGAGPLLEALKDDH